MQILNASVSGLDESVLGSLATDPRAVLCLIIFFLSYLFVITEERTRLHKSKPVMLGAGLIWIIIALAAPDYGIDDQQLHRAISHDLDEYASLALFLLAAMTYIAALSDTGVFEALRASLVRKRLSYRGVFWVTGAVAFLLSAIANNLSTALVMGSVVMAIGAKNPRFVSIAMVNIVCATNSGGAFSPFGDVTTLMVWQSDKVQFTQFFALFLPSLASYLVPAAIMVFFVPKGMPAVAGEHAQMARGARRVICLGLFTIAMAVSFEKLLGLPPFLGMMVGMSLLMILGYYLKSTRRDGEPDYDVFEAIRSAEWDTILFFFGVIFSVGGLTFIGYMSVASASLYGTWGATASNIVLGGVSAVIDNIPVMFSVLSMKPQMNVDQWLLLTLTCGIGGSLLSVGSAAGVALMGVSKGHYTFMSHLRWSPVIALGYFAGVVFHLI